jgi:hypothetical protein
MVDTIRCDFRPILVWPADIKQVSTFEERIIGFSKCFPLSNSIAPPLYILCRGKREKEK